MRVRGVLLIIALILVLLAAGLGIVELIALPFGGLGLAPGILLGLFVVVAVLAVVSMIGGADAIARAAPAPPDGAPAGALDRTLGLGSPCLRPSAWS